MDIRDNKMYRGLTSFRALAFLAVFVYHCELFPPGYLGVQAFFVLSGFLLIPIIVDMKESMPPRRFLINFYGRRMLRIFPLYYLYLSVVLLISLVITNTTNEIKELALFVEGQAHWAFTYTFNFLYASHFYKATPWLTHFWSLSVEEQFYLVYPVLLIFINKKHLKRFLLTNICLGPVLRFIIVIIHKNGVASFLNGQIDLVIYALPFSYIDAFAMGGYFALYQKSDKSNLQTLVLIYFSILLGYFAQYISTGYVDIFSFGYRAVMHDQYIWGYSIMNFVFAKILTQTKDGKFFPLLFDNFLLRYLGKISYGLYIFHLPIIALILYANPSLSNKSVGLISLLLTIFISSACYELYEKRFLKLKEKFFPKALSI